MNRRDAYRAVAVGLALLAAAVPRGSASGDCVVWFLGAGRPGDAGGPESRAACALAESILPTTRVWLDASGSLVGEAGQALSGDGPRVIWYHQGDDIEPPSVALISNLRELTGRGRGLFLSGAALRLVHELGLEPAVPRVAPSGTDRYLARLVPVVPEHPAFRGLAGEGVCLDASVGGNPREFGVSITDAGYPAFADFHGSGGPQCGLLLAHAAAGAENPLVEYELGRGRAIAFGWRLPHYAHAANAHRANLERLTGNILRYLAEPAQWRPLPPPAQPAAGGAPDVGVSSGEWEALRLAIGDLISSFGERYPRGAEYARRLDELEAEQAALLAAGPEPATESRGELTALVTRFAALRREALLANPLLASGRLLLVRRGMGQLGLPNNWEANTEIPMTGYDNEIALLEPIAPDGHMTTLFRPDGGRFVGDVDLHFDGERMLFSMPGSNGRWQVWELGIAGGALRELPLITEPDVDNYDACYLPDGGVIFASTATFAGVPCVFGASHVTNLYLLGADRTIRQLTVDQDHNWCPTLLHDGRVLYLRWEYTDLPHSNSRILFVMNPDGTGQAEYYGSNSFFPNSFFYARPVPGHPTMVAGIATGHHGTRRSGRLLLLDPARGRQEAAGVVQEIPGRGRAVAPLIRDTLVDGVWPQFLHPFPLSAKYCLVSARPSPGSPWGIYLVDTFDNMVPVREEPGWALLEPILARPVRRPPAIPARVDAARRDALVLMVDVHAGGGLAGVPRGAVKRLRLFTYHYGYRGMGGLLGAVGMDGPWDIKRVLGTVPVERDGSAFFRVPANTPIAVQPLDAEGQALQMMRSWFTAMPGEEVTCMGCHEPRNAGTPQRRPLAAGRAPSEIEPWYGAPRGFAFAREVQPVLDRLCIGCHDGEPAPDGSLPCDLRGLPPAEPWSSGIAGHVDPAYGGKFSRAYNALHRFVRRPGIESDIRMLTPLEFHAGTTELVQLLRKGHYGVRLGDEAWDRLLTWIDLNAPYHGTWSEIVGAEQVRSVAERRRAMSLRYAGVADDPEAIPAGATAAGAAGGPVYDRSMLAARRADAAQPAPAASGPGNPHGARPGEDRCELDLGDGVVLELVRVPAGAFVMGDAAGDADEQPRHEVEVSAPFWMGACEVTNEQYRRFDPAHDSRVEPMHGYQFGIHGWPVNGPRQPAVRVSWEEAVRFCDWLSARACRPVSLPTEAQWEYACRAGAAGPFWFGERDADFSACANTGDVTLRELALDTYITVRLVADPGPSDDWVPRDMRFDDGALVSVDVGSYRANPWGLHDMHGNVAEWTRSVYWQYPYRDGDGRNDPAADGDRVVRGGAWYDRPQRCRAGFRLAYRPYQRVFDVGFRVVVAEGDEPLGVRALAVAD